MNNHLALLVSSPLVLLVIILISFATKAYFILHFYKRIFFYKRTIKTTLLVWATGITASFFGDIAWIVKITRQLWFPEMDYAIITFLIRIAWAFAVIQYQALSLIIKSLVEKRLRLSIAQYLTYGIGIFFIGYLLMRAFFYADILCTEEERELAKATNAPEIIIIKAIMIYSMCLLLLALFEMGLKKLYNSILPKILLKQIRIFVFYTITYFCIELVQALFFSVKPTKEYTHFIVALSTVWLIYALYYCVTKVMKLRFLNFERHVQSPLNSNLIQDFKLVLEQLSNVRSLDELQLIAQSFFKQGFNIPLSYSRLFISPVTAESTTNFQEESDSIEHHIQAWFARADQKALSYITKTQVLIYDEIDFNLHYEESAEERSVMRLLTAIKADIIIPLYTNRIPQGYLVVTRNARPDECYSEVERNAMLIFSSYLANIINLIQSKNTQTLLQQQKELKEEIFYKHQEVNQYKESINFFLQQTKQKDIGILFYKNRRFSYGNQAARKLITFDVNIQQGHPFSVALKKLAQHVYAYKTPSSQLAKINGDLVSIAGIPQLGQDAVIITTSSPDIAEYITKQMSYLRNPGEWEYLLYLKTTRAGQLIENSIPGNGEQLINFKMQLLKFALSKASVMIDMADDDIEDAIKVIQLIGLRDSLHILELREPEKESAFAQQLFGLNPTLSGYVSPLLKRFDDGIIFIKNVHFLSLNSQQRLLDFLKVGWFKAVDSDHHQPSNARIIFSSDRDLFTLVQRNEFDHDLFAKLKEHRLIFPSLLTLENSEFTSLAQGYADQIIQEHPLSNFLAIGDKDIMRLASNRPTTLKELKSKVHQWLVNKSKHHAIEEPLVAPALHVTEPLLIEAVRLGKQALKDRKIMVSLWNKFKNQSKIAEFLGVNRSSVNRRCKEYRLS